MFAQPVNIQDNPIKNKFPVLQKYFQSSADGPKNLAGDVGQSYLSFEWTNQHGCGGNEDTDPHKLNCNIVLQYMCQENVASPTGMSFYLP